MKKQEAMGNVHEHARTLIDRNPLEGLEPEEQRWLANHLTECNFCALRAASTEAAVRSLRTTSVPLPAGLAASTKLRVREEATKLKARRARNVALIAGCTLSWVAGVASAPLIWKLFEWLGTKLELPRIVWELGFLSWWLVPAASVGLVILWVNARTEREEYNGWLEAGPGSKEL